MVFHLAFSQVDAYLASLEQEGGAEDGTLDYLVDSRPTERPETSLGEEVQKLLRESEGFVGPQPTDPLHNHSNASTLTSDEEREDEDSHLNKEEAYRQALDEADILKAHEADEKGDSSTPSAPTDISTTTSIEPADPTALLAALSTPSNLPVLEQDLPDDPTFARLLGLTPSAEAPTTKTPAAPKGNAPNPLDIAGWRAARDNAVESWCCEYSPLSFFVQVSPFRTDAATLPSASQRFAPRMLSSSVLGATTTCTVGCASKRVILMRTRKR